MRLGELAVGSKILLYTAVNQLKPVYGKTILQGTIVDIMSECTITVQMENEPRVLTECYCEVTNNEDEHIYRYACTCIKEDDKLIISSHNDCDWHGIRQEMRYNIKIPCWLSTAKGYVKAFTNDLSLHGIGLNIDNDIRIAIGDKRYVRLSYENISGVSTVEIKYVKYIGDKKRVGGLVIDNFDPMTRIVNTYIASKAKLRKQ